MNIFEDKKIFLFVLLMLFLIPILVFASSKSIREAIIRFVLTQEGKFYYLGAYGPDKWDCSSLVNYAYNKAGLKGFTIGKMPNPHGPTAQQQYEMSEEIPKNQICLLFF